MKNIFENMFGFLYTLSMGDYIFFILTFITIIAFIYVIYLIKYEDIKREKNEDISFLEEIKNEIETNYKPEYKNITEYEKEQEENAIISYEELLNNKNSYYKEEVLSNDEDLVIKKIDINNIEDKKTNEKVEVKLLDYKEYEEFLSTLKQLQQKLLN